VQNNSTGQALGVVANKANADRFAANIIPIIREIQASGVTTLRGVAGDPGLIAYECPDCGHLTSVLVPPNRRLGG
jgi:hypothetical protein